MMVGRSKENAFDLRREAEGISEVFPPLMVEAERLANTVASGVHGRRRSGPGETFWQHRPYSYGDPVSAIDWRQSARAADRLYVRQNEWESAATIWLWRDPSKSLDYRSQWSKTSKRRRAEVIVTALAILLSQGGERIGLLAGHRRAVQGRAAPARILEALLSESAPEAPSTLPRSPVQAGCSVVILSDFFCDSSELGAAIASYSSAGARGVLLQIVDPAEEDFPFSGRTEFHDPETPARFTIGDAQAAGPAYRQLFQAHRREVATTALRHDWRFFSHRTDAPATDALLSLYVALRDQRAIGGGVGMSAGSGDKGRG